MLFALERRTWLVQWQSDKPQRAPCRMPKPRILPEEPLPRKRPRIARPLSLEDIRRWNPRLDDEQGPRAHLRPLAGLAGLLDDPAWTTRPAVHALDLVVDALAGTNTGREATAHWHRVSRQAVAERDLQLFSLDCSAEMLAASMWAGFFPFASEFRFPGRPLEQRGLLNLELGGPEIDRVDGDPGGRVVLDLSPESADRLAVGKRSLKKALGSYRLTVNGDFEGSWAAIVQAHGVD